MNDEQDAACSFCDSPVAANPHEEAALEPVEVAALARPVAVPSSEPDWRREVAHRLEAYRTRRRKLLPDDSSTPLLFSDLSAEDGSSNGENGSHAHDASGHRAVTPPKPRRAERVEIAILQPALDFNAADEVGLHPEPAEGGLIPVTPLEERFRAAMLDAAFLLASYLGFLVLFGSLGGQFSFGKADTVVYLLTFALFYAQYFALFTIFGGPTPGMRLRKLDVVSFDGSAPSHAQLLWRSFGYLVSAGTLSLGFLWSLWDEDHLTWQDRISQTYITRISDQ